MAQGRFSYLPILDDVIEYNLMGLVIVLPYTISHASGKLHWTHTRHIEEVT